MEETAVIPKIEAYALVKEYGKRRVVNNVDINLSAGEIVGLLGPNGAGKTTTFYMIMGLIPTSGGKILLNDHELTKLSMHRRARSGIGFSS